LNNWNENRKLTNKEFAYISSFLDENLTNQENLSLALDFSRSTKKDIDSLKSRLLNESYSDIEIQNTWLI
jgi:hypothetical protein